VKLRIVLLVLIALSGPAARAQEALYYPFFVVFGDSLSDTGQTYTATNNYCQNVFLQVNPNGVCNAYPGPSYGYASGVFTDGLDSNPAAQHYFLVWHQELSLLLRGYTGGVLDTGNEVSDAWGGAQTTDGVFEDNNGPAPVTAENMGQQVADFLNSGPPDPEYLYILFGGMNDLLADSSSTNAAAAAQRLTALVQRLANAGATHFLIPNLPLLTANASPSFEAAVAIFNTNLASDLSALQTQYAVQGVSISVTLVDVNSLFNTIAVDPSSYGFTNLTDPAQKAGSSIDPDTYLSWDGINPTTAGHYEIAYAACTALTQTQTTVTVSALSSTATSPATITATVSTNGTYGPLSASTPTGLVTFYSSGTAVGSAPLQADGTATLSAQSLPVGTLDVTAVYSGDINFPQGCPARHVSLQVLSDVPSYTLKLNPTELPIDSGGEAYTNVTATSSSNSSTVLMISCGTLPAGFSCNVLNPQIKPNSPGGATVQIYAEVLAGSASSPALEREGRDPIFFAFAVPLGLLGLALRRRRYASLLMLTFAAAILTSCAVGTSANGGGSKGGGGGTPPTYTYPAAGSYTIPVIATAEGTTQTVTANLLVVTN
jgi:phospholipase/lecithinase/hemolysin